MDKFIGSTEDKTERNEDIIALKDLFGESAHIDNQKDGFHIFTTLRDAICEGGQVVDGIVGKRTTRRKLENISDLIIA